jgi:hypothetical protein
MNPAIVSAIKDYQIKLSVPFPVSRIGEASLPALNIKATKQPIKAPQTYATI